MAQVECNLNLYKTPSIEIVRHRKEFYGLWTRCDDEPASWLNRVQIQINRCEFPAVISREFLLIDKFVCELNDEQREFIHKANTWTLAELIDYFANRKGSNGANPATTIDKSIHHNKQQIPSSSLASPSMVAIKCEFVSIHGNRCNCFFCVVMFHLYTMYTLCYEPFQDGYEYAQNAANIEDANVENTFIDIKSEPNSLIHGSSSMVYLPNDITTNTFGAVQSVSEPDAIDGILSDDIEFQCVSIFSIQHSISQMIQSIKCFISIWTGRLQIFRKWWYHSRCECRFCRWGERWWWKSNQSANWKGNHSI